MKIKDLIKELEKLDGEKTIGTFTEKGLKDNIMIIPIPTGNKVEYLIG